MVRLVDTLESSGKQPLALSQHLRRLSKLALRHARDLLNLFGVVGLDDVLQLVEADGALLNELQSISVNMPGYRLSRQIDHEKGTDAKDGPLRLDNRS